MKFPRPETLWTRHEVLVLSIFVQALLKLRNEDALQQFTAIKLDGVRPLARVQRLLIRRDITPETIGIEAHFLITATHHHIIPQHFPYVRKS